MSAACAQCVAHVDAAAYITKEGVVVGLRVIFKILAGLRLIDPRATTNIPNQLYLRKLKTYKFLRRFFRLQKHKSMEV